MLASGHRTTHEPLAPSPHGSTPRGGAPMGMWRVAWRLHRMHNLVLLLLTTVFISGLIIFRRRVVSTYQERGCAIPGHPGQSCTDAQGYAVWWNNGLSDWWGFFHGAILIGAILVGAFAAAPIFTREFSHSTHVFALSQSIRPGLWFAAKIVMVAVPMTAALLAVGFVMQWVDLTTADTDTQALSTQMLFTRGPMPAATALVAFGVAIAVGMTIRSTIGTIAAASGIALVLVIGTATVAPLLLPSERTITPMAEYLAPITQQEYDARFEPTGMGAAATTDPNELRIGSGYLDITGREIGRGGEQFFKCSEQAERIVAARHGGSIETFPQGGMSVDLGATNETEQFQFENEVQEAHLACVTESGFASTYADTLPSSMLWALRGVAGGLLLILSAVAIVLGRRLLPAAIARR